MAGLTLRHQAGLVFIAYICRGFKLLKRERKKTSCAKVIAKIEKGKTKEQEKEKM